MLLFRSEEHVDRWCALWNRPRGATLSLEQGWALAQEWYGPDRRDPAWHRKTVDEIELLFATLRLTGPFWQLRG
jgi:hypothetical protein